MWQDYIRSIRSYCLILLFIPALAVAAGPQKTFFVEGQDYVKVAPEVRNSAAAQQVLMSDPHKVQVLFFFSYACHGCEMFHAPFQKWAAEQKLKPNNKTVIYEYPVSFNAQWGMLERMYYVMESLDPNKKLNDAIFIAVHKKGMKLWDPAVMKNFFLQHGYSANQFDLAFNSFMVNRQVQRADAVSKAFGIVVTPEVVVNGPTNSYKLDFVKAGNNIQRLLDILNYLVERESKLF